MARPLGSQNRDKLVAADYARQVVNDPEYRKALLARAIAGTLAPGMESLIWYYAFGRPVERIITDLTVSPLTDLSEEQLALRADLIAKQLRARNDEDDPDDGSGDVH